MKESYKNNNIKILAPTWKNKIELSDGSYSVSDNQDYYEYIIKYDEILTDNPLINMYVNKTENRTKFEIKTKQTKSFNV